MAFQLISPNPRLQIRKMMSIRTLARRNGISMIRSNVNKANNKMAITMDMIVSALAILFYPCYARFQCGYSAVLAPAWANGNARKYRRMAAKSSIIADR